MATYNGTAGNDSLSGGGASDLFNGYGGNDTLSGGGGADTIYGGDGNDSLIGGSGSDSLFGGAGNDTASYSASSAAVAVNLATGVGSGGHAAGDILAEIENLIGSTYNDTLTGDSGANRIFGGSGNDVMAGGSGADTLDGGGGTDLVDYSASGAGVTVSLASGTGTGGDAEGDILTSIEMLTGSSFADALTGDGNANTLTGGAGDDSLYGGSGDDSLYGGDGNDVLASGTGADRVEGGAGNDTVDYSGSTSAVNVNLASGAGSGGEAAGDTLVGVENIFASLFNDTLYGTTGNNLIRGFAGNDYISTDAGDDTLHGGAGRDTLYGGSGMDFLDYSDSNAAVSINLASNTASGGHATGDVLSGVDGVFGSVFDDTLIGFDFEGISGDVFTNVFFGGGGNDYIDAGGANDAVYGGSGNDTLIAGSGDDTAGGGAGNDQIFGGSGNDTITGDAGNDTIDAGTGNDTIDGGTGNDSVSGGDGNDSLTGDTGNDTIAGGAGNDTLVGGTGSDVFYAGAGDVVVGGAGDNDQLIITGSDPYRIIKDPGDPTSGVVEFLDSFGNVIGTITFSGIDTGIACFTPGTQVETDQGPRPIECLAPGDRVLTRDNGFQTIRWVGRKRFAEAELREDAALYPVLLRKGALGPGLPERDMMVSRQHRMLLCSPRAELYFGEDEVFVRALHMVGQPDVLHAMVPEVTYLHLMFDRHEVVLADGVWSESFQPAARNIGGLDEDQRHELLKVFPEMPGALEPEAFRSARLTLKSHEARALLATEPPARPQKAA